MKRFAPLILLLALAACATAPAVGPGAATTTRAVFTGGIWECDIFSVAWGGGRVEPMALEAASLEFFPPGWSHLP